MIPLGVGSIMAALCVNRRKIVSSDVLLECAVCDGAQVSLDTNWIFNWSLSPSPCAYVCAHVCTLMLMWMSHSHLKVFSDLEVENQAVHFIKAY